MDDNINKEIQNIKKEYTDYFAAADKQSIFYFIQLIEMFYNELCYEVYDKDLLYDLICNDYKSDINNIFKNLKDYFLSSINNSVKGFNEIIKISVSNKYVNTNNLNNIYNNFKKEVTTSMNIKEKIEVIVGTNGSKLIDKLHSTCVVSSNKPNLIIDKYTKLIKEEMVKNIDSKLDCLLSSYRYLIDTIIEDLIGDKSKINDLNNKVISNATYVYLKEQEYFVINKYNDENFDTLNKLFDEFEKMVEENGIKKNPKMEFNLTRDFFLGFNNTIGVKIKNIFDEMNLVATMDGININKKLKEFNDLISHIYEINLNFDKQFSKYKKEYVLNSRNIDKFDSLYEEFKSKIIENIKVSISNIFRENIKIYNDIIYKSFGLKAKIDDFSYVLSEDKVKDLLLK